MKPLPERVTDLELIAFVDRWAALMEQEDYNAAFALTDHVTEMAWTPELIRAVVKNYGDCRPEQRLTVSGVASDVSQRKRVDRWPLNRFGEVGEIWYDLNIDGVASDLTATFRIVELPQGLSLRLKDIHVM